MKARWKIAVVLILLLAGGMKWITHDMSKTSSFLNAAYAGQVDVVQTMLKAGENVDAQDPKFNSTALILAAQQGHVDIVRLLLDNHADINAMTKHGQTALSQAAYNGHMDVVKLLIEHGAKLDARLRPSVLDAVHEHPDIVKILPVEQGK